jgi:hypothetical protein
LNQWGEVNSLLINAVVTVAEPSEQSSSLLSVIMNDDFGWWNVVHFFVSGAADLDV